MLFYVYIILSSGNNKTYVGHTDNLVRRLKEHNSGKSIYTKKYNDWSFLHTESFKTEQETIVKEKYFKSRAGRMLIKKNLFHK